MDAKAAIWHLAQSTHTLIYGNADVTIESATTITKSSLALWQTGSCHPSEHYPFTLEETLQACKGGLKTQEDYSKDVQSFTPSHPASPLGIGRGACGIVKHPKTGLWQIWMIMGGPCTFLAAYLDPNKAQRNLEKIINIARGGNSILKGKNIAYEAQKAYSDKIRP